MPDGFILVILQSDYCFDMYNDKHIVKCRPFPHIADNVCSGDAPSLAEALFVCPAFSKISNRKCADYLAVWKIRVNTHTHTHTQSLRASRYKLSSKYQSVSEKIFRQFCYNPIPKTFDTSYPSVAIGSERNYCARRRYTKYVTVPVCRRPALCPTRKNQCMLYE